MSMHACYRWVGGWEGDNAHLLTVPQGDFYPAAASINEPLFMIHHSNIVRSHYSWMMNNADSAECFYGYPMSGFALNISGEALPTYLGIGLNDTVSSNFPFTWDDIGHPQDGASATPWTHAEVLFYFQAEYSPYTYDSFELMV